MIKMTEAQQQEFVKKLGLVKGDTVRVLRKVADWPPYNWAEEMDSCINNTVTVLYPKKNTDSFVGRFEGESRWVFPYSCLFATDEDYQAFIGVLDSPHSAVLKALNLKIGDIVIPRFRVPDSFNGWNSCWAGVMDSALGKEFEVSRIAEGDGGVRLSFGAGYWFPSFCLEKVVKPKTIEVKLNDGYTATVHADKVVVGCQTFAPEKVKELQSALDKLNETGKHK